MSRPWNSDTDAVASKRMVLSRSQSWSYDWVNVPATSSVSQVPSGCLRNRSVALDWPEPWTDYNLVASDDFAVSYRFTLGDSFTDGRLDPASFVQRIYGAEARPRSSPASYQPPGISPVTAVGGALLGGVRSDRLGAPRVRGVGRVAVAACLATRGFADELRTETLSPFAAPASSITRYRSVGALPIPNMPVGCS